MDVNEYIKNRIMPHRRGLMGTVIFHLILAIFFLSMEISRMEVHREMEIVMEEADEEEVRQKEEEVLKREEIREKSSEDAVDEMLRSIAVNEHIRREQEVREKDLDRYVADIVDELHKDGDDGRYAVRKDRNFERDSMQHESDKRLDGQDSLRSVFYAGKSSVSYRLEGRTARFLPIPVFRCESGGVVTVRIGVDPRGIVQKAVVVRSKSADDENLWQVAVEAAERSRFSAKAGAPSLQTGRITYHFVKQ